MPLNKKCTCPIFSVPITLALNPPLEAQNFAELEAAEPARQVRVIRDRLLAESDWTQNRDVVLLNDTTWKQYRQDLRDLPASASFTPKLDSNGDLDMSSVTWPLKPS